MLSWQIWRSLNHAQTPHPLVRRLSGTVPTDSRSLSGCLGDLGAVFALFTWPLGVLFFATPLGATWFGAMLAFRCAGVIAQQRTQGILELLSVTVPGGLANAWALVTLSYQVREEVYQFYTVMYWLIIVPFSGLACAALALSTFANRSPLLTLLILIVFLIGMLGALYTDRIQSMVLGAVTGLLGAYHEQGRAGAQLWALGVFLGMQLLLYSFLLVVLLIAVNLRVWWLPLLGTTLFILAREGALHLLWTAALDQINADLNEADRLLKGK